MSSSISSPRNRRLNRRRTKRGRSCRSIFWAWSRPDLELIRPGASASDRRRESHPSAANGGQHQADSSDGSKHLSNVQKTLQAVTGNRSSLLRLAGAKWRSEAAFPWARRRLWVGDFGRAALFRRTRGQFSKHHFDADKRASTRQKPHGTGDALPADTAFTNSATRRRQSSASSTRHREP